jgi:hypothetical protein
VILQNKKAWALIPTTADRFPKISLALFANLADNYSDANHLRRISQHAITPR